MEGTSQFYQCTCGDQFRPFTHSWYGREPTVQQDYHIWSENTTKPREESREENFTDSSDTGRCGNPDGRPSIDWDVFMPWSSIADPEDLKRLSELPVATPTKWDRYIDEQLSPYASCAEEEEREAGRPRRLRPRTAPVRLRAGGPLAKPPTPSAPGRCSTQLPCSTESGTCPKKAEGRHGPGSAQSTPAGRTQQAIPQGAGAGAGASGGGRQGASGRRRPRLEEEASESGPFSPCGLLPEDQLYSEAVRRELRRLMGPEEAPSGVPAPSQPPPPSPAPSLPSFPSGADAPLSATSPAPSPAPSPTRALAPAAARASSARAESAGAGAEAGSWPRAALSTRWLNDHLCAKRCSQPCPPRRGREERQAEAGALGAAGLRRARAEAAARLREAVAAAERAARHQAAAGADPQLAEAAAAAAARDYRTFVVGHVHGELPPSATRIASGGRKGGDASAGGAALGAGGEPAVRIVGYVGVTRPATPPATPTPQRLQQQQQQQQQRAAAPGEARRRLRP